MVYTNILKDGTIRYVDEHLRDDDAGYVRWLSLYTGSRRGSHPVEDRDRLQKGVTKVVYEAARALLRGRCLLCFDGTGEEWKSWCPSCYRGAE